VATESRARRGAPLPPHITLKDAKNFMMMMPPEPELGDVLKNSIKEVFASVLPHKKS
jgi:pyruvate dehydrogenase (quinone)